MVGGSLATGKPSLAAMSGLALPLATLAGTWFALPQWWVLRSGVPNARWWLTATVVGYLLTYVVGA